MTPGLYAIGVSRRQHRTGVVYPLIDDESPAARFYTPGSVSGVGALYSYTVFHPSARDGLAPYGLAYVDFPDGERVFGRLALDGIDPRRLANGSAVEAIEEPDLASGFFFRIVGSGS